MYFFSSLCKNASVKVDFQMLKTGFIVIFYRSESEMTDKMTDKNAREQAVINFLKTNPFATNGTICELLDISNVTTKRLLKKW